MFNVERGIAKRNYTGEYTLNVVEVTLQDNGSGTLSAVWNYGFHSFPAKCRKTKDQNC